MHAIDARVRSSRKRMRENDITTRRLLQKRMNGVFPFQDDVDTLNAALDGVTATSKEAAPDFDLRSPPQQVFEWTRDVVQRYGERCRQQGRALEREEKEPRLSPDVAREAMLLLSRLNQLLSEP